MARKTKPLVWVKFQLTKQERDAAKLTARFEATAWQQWVRAQVIASIKKFKVVK